MGAVQHVSDSGEWRPARRRARPSVSKPVFLMVPLRCAATLVANARHSALVHVGAPGCGRWRTRRSPHSRTPPRATMGQRVMGLQSPPSCPPHTTVAGRDSAHAGAPAVPLTRRLEDQRQHGGCLERGATHPKDRQGDRFGVHGVPPGLRSSAVRPTCKPFAADLWLPLRPGRGPNSQSGAIRVACSRSGTIRPAAPAPKPPRPSSRVHRRPPRARSGRGAGGRRTRRRPGSSRTATRC